MANISNKEEREILRWRAMELARSTHEAIASQDVEAFLEFRVMGMRYAVYLNQVDVVGRVDEVFMIPKMPAHITGVIRRRGQPVVLISLVHFFYPTIRGVRDADYALVVVAQGKRFALQVEDIEGVCQFERSDLLPSADHISSEQAPYIHSVTKSGIAVIDLDKLIEAESFSFR